jgi:HD-GYP domain-containing protein (c-di-GMP phosphodiesterase class II)/DNA-binding CsgD family transcriptional regulator
VQAVTAAVRVRLSELIASLSLATDIGMGQPMDHALRTCLLALAIAQEMGLSKEQCNDVYYLALLRFVGCNGHADADARESGGDEVAFRAAFAPVVTGEMQEVMTHLFRHLGEGLPRPTRAKLLASMLAGGSKRALQTIEASCEVAQMMAARLGFGESLVTALGYSFEYWNGKGMPKRAEGEEIPISARVAIVARDVEVFDRIGGREVADEILLKRRGRAYDPAVADAFTKHAWKHLERIDDEPVWEAVIAADPSESPFLSGPHLEEAFRCFADMTDLKCSFTRGHSPFVSQLASKAASFLGLSNADLDCVLAAGLVQELGKTGISNGILEKPGSLTAGEWERVRLHPYLSERILSRCEPLAAIASLGGAHHERMNGSGYYHGSSGAQIPVGARILGVADSYRAMTSERPWRPALSVEDAAQTLREEVAAGRLDAEVVDTVLAASGQEISPRKHTWPAGLSDREVEVLRLISVGKSNREVAERLVISPKTVGRHIENIYAKIGVSTRAAAALFAMQQDLIT